MSVVETVLLCPFDLTVEPIARFLNAELADDPVYDGIELQWFDDLAHGTGMLAFLSRRDDRRVDYYVEPGLTLDRSGYELGAGMGRWMTTDFEQARLEVATDGVVADVRFTDVDGRTIEVAVDDRGTRPRQCSDLLAPVGSTIDDPVSLMLVYLHGFDLLRRSGHPPRINVDGRAVSTGVLPGGLLHRRHLIKAAAPLTVASLCRTRTGPLDPVNPDEPGTVILDDAATGIVGLAAHHADATATFRLEPPLPSLATLTEGRPETGAWQVEVDGAVITGGDWSAVRERQHIELGLDVTRRWDPPPGQPVLMWLVTRVIPTFRRWPRSYRWTATVTLDDGPAHISSGWERTAGERGDAYRRATRG